MSCNCGDNNCSKNSRRDFLVTGLLATAALTGCSDKKNPFTPDDEVIPSGEKVKLLSVDGEIIEIDKAFLKPSLIYRDYQIPRKERGCLAKNL
jgi:molybdopterin-containing oxidoreductase family iron-sulfur binding subunit